MAHSRTHSVDTEMHELNQEADYLEEKTHIVPGSNGSDAKLQRHDNDPDAQAMVVASLRSQIQDLFSQVSQLNSKLVSSYDRVSDLEDELHVTSANLRSTTLKVSKLELELERSRHLSALSTGLLVEKNHLTNLHTFGLVIGSAGIVSLYCAANLRERSLLYHFKRLISSYSM